ncbi:hypothetical protein NYY88_19400, partial [Acinetobacter baumannii]|nr:hypothetical protein [Acinetobacter baumannii]
LQRLRWRPGGHGLRALAPVEPGAGRGAGGRVARGEDFRTDPGAGACTRRFGAGALRRRHGARG